MFTKLTGNQGCTYYDLPLLPCEIIRTNIVQKENLDIMIKERWKLVITGNLKTIAYTEFHINMLFS